MIWIILLIATILRLIKLEQSLWLDEAINVLASQNYSFWDMVTKYPIGDFHPPLYFALLWLWVKIGGVGEIWVRLPSVIFGVATIWLVYLLGKEMFSKRITLLGALFMALAPLHVYYSQEARMYSLATLAATLSFYFFWKVLYKGNWGYMGGYGVSSVLVLYSDYLVYLIFPAQFLFLVIWNRKVLVRFMVPWFVSMLTIIPWLAIFSKQLSTGIAAASTLPGWANVVGGASIKELLLIPVKTFFGRVSIDNKQIYWLVSGAVVIFYAGIVWNAVKKIDNETKLLILWISVPVILAFLISFYIPVLSYFRMLFILPAFYLLLAKGVYSLNIGATPVRRRLLWLVAGMICMVSIISLGAYYTNPKFQREDWKGVVKAVDELAKDDGIILFENNNLLSPFIYYSEDRSLAMGGLRKVPALSEQDLNITPNTKNIYLFEYLVEITDPRRLLQKNIEKSGFKNLETLNFNGVGFVYHYQLK